MSPEYPEYPPRGNTREYPEYAWNTRRNTPGIRARAPEYATIAYQADMP